MVGLGERTDEGGSASLQNTGNLRVGVPRSLKQERGGLEVAKGGTGGGF